MNPMGLYELAQIAEQEHMRATERRAAVRTARREARAGAGRRLRRALKPGWLASRDS